MGNCGLITDLPETKAGHTAIVVYVDPAVGPLCTAELVAVESHRPLILQQHSTTAKTTGIHHNFKRQIRISTGA